MVFSSIPAYLDPSNWNQQQNHQIIGSSSRSNPLLPPPPQPGPPPPPSQPHGDGSIRPGSMAERARMANIPLPETCLKCPRCESTNTKFCYFNNYSLSQPRHFCKTCRRYWTRGGALRNVPVGGGCRRNKRSSSKPSTSKSPAACTNPSPTSTSATTPQFPPLRFMSPLSQFTDNFATGISSNSTGEMNLHGGGGIDIEPWRLQQQFPFFGGKPIDTSGQGIYQFHGGGESGFLGSEMRPRFSSPGAAVKMEERRQMLGGNEQWNAGITPNWTELSSFPSSSTTNPL